MAKTVFDVLLDRIEELKTSSAAYFLVAAGSQRKTTPDYREACGTSSGSEVPHNVNHPRPLA